MTQKTVKFSNVSFENNETCNVTVEIELTDKEEGKVFTACAFVKKGRREIMGCQCLDTIYESSELKNNEKFVEIYEFWKKYHLNDLHAGTPEQEQCLKESKWHGVNASEYTEQCEYLKEHNLLTVNLNGEPYKFGTKWLFQAIPENDLKRIEELVA